MQKRLEALLTTASCGRRLTLALQDVEEMMDPKREARVIYHLRHAVAEPGLAHALTGSRQVQQTSERFLSELDDLLYLLAEGTAEEAP